MSEFLQSPDPRSLIDVDLAAETQIGDLISIQAKLNSRPSIWWHFARLDGSVATEFSINNIMMQTESKSLRHLDPAPGTISISRIARLDMGLGLNLEGSDKNYFTREIVKLYINHVLRLG